MFCFGFPRLSSNVHAYDVHYAVVIRFLDLPRVRLRLPQIQQLHSLLGIKRCMLASFAHPKRLLHLLVMWPLPHSLMTFSKSSIITNAIMLTRRLELQQTQMSSSRNYLLRLHKISSNIAQQSDVELVLTLPVSSQTPPLPPVRSPHKVCKIMPCIPMH